MEELSYSLHLGNDKNKSKRARRTAKTNDTNTTSFNNNAIQNHQQLSKVDKHNLRKYDDDKELICIIKGTSSIVEDTKNLYLDLFEDARIKYNVKQTRNDRKIENYFNHISNDNKRDLACEIIIELGDMDFWANKDDKFRKKMIEVFKEQIVDLEEVVPNFKIANATIHFDESSPHLHIVGVPFKDGMKNGMEKQVGKSDVFNKISLVNIQDKMREYCINSFNRIYHLNYTLKAKEEGRNVDINVANMNEYKKFKREQEKYKIQLKELNNKTDELQNKSNEINDIIDNLKPTITNKNNFTISNENIDKIKKYIEQTNATTSNLRDANDINNKYMYSYFILSVIKRLSGTEDAHTMYNVKKDIPINFKMFEDNVLINYPKNLKGSELISINGVDIKQIITELDEIVTYGTLGRRRSEIEKSLFNEIILYGLPSLRNSKCLEFTYKNRNNEIESIVFEQEKEYSQQEKFDSDEYYYGTIASYYFRDNCLIYNHSTVQTKFEEKIKETIQLLEKEDISSIDTIIVDLRGNHGGNSKLNHYLMSYLEKHIDKKIICLTDYRVFSAGRYALIDLIRLGALTIGEEIGTPLNCYGDNNWKECGYNHYFASSSKYFNPLMRWGAASKEQFNNEITEKLLEQQIFKPDIYVSQTKEDYINGVDTILEYAIEYSKDNKKTI